MSPLLGHVARTLGSLVLAGLVMRWTTRQLRKPKGRAVLYRMNLSHAGVTAWGLSHLDIRPDFTILDVGCGGGRTIERLASMAPNGKVRGVDYSEASVDMSRDTNRALIEQGRVDVQLGNVSALPFPDRAFDLVTAVETHYYWPDLPHDVREVERVLKPGGTFAIIAETYKGRRNDWLYRPTMQLVLRAAYLSPAEHRQLLVDAGYTDVEVFKEKSRGWICALGTRPERS